jgi:hypothetical protein
MGSIREQFTFQEGTDAIEERFFGKHDGYGFIVWESGTRAKWVKAAGGEYQFEKAP